MKRACLLEVSEAHGLVIHIVINVTTLEEGLADEPIAAEVSRAKNTSGAVVALFILLKGERFRVNVEILAAKVKAHSRRLCAVVVTLDSAAGILRCKASGFEKLFDGLLGAENDRGARVGSDGDITNNCLAVDGGAAVEGPKARRWDGGELTGELVGGNGAVVQLAGAVGAESKAESAGGQGPRVAQGEKEGLLAESSPVQASVANEAVVREGGRRTWAVNGAEGLL